MSLNLKTCYRETGQVAPGDIPCDPTAAVSACCSPGSVCRQNFFCQATNTTTGISSSVPGTCTDQQWGVKSSSNPACPCRPYYRNDGSTMVVSYNDSVTACSDGSVCCGIGNVDCCNAGKGSPRIIFNNPAPVPGNSSGYPAYYARLKGISQSPAPKATGNSMIDNGSGGVLAQLPWAARIGLGVGLGVTGLLLLASFVFLVMSWRRHCRLKRNGGVGGRKEVG